MHLTARFLEEYYEKLLNIVLPHRHRWQSLKYLHLQANHVTEDSSRDGQDLVQEIFIPSGPTLESTLLEELDLVFPEPATAIFTDRVTFPKLKSITFSRFSPWASGSPLLWSNLETLRLTCIGLIDMYATLPNLANLRELTLSHHTYGPLRPNSVNFEPNVLPGLESLSLTDACPLLRMIVTPALKTFILLDDGKQDFKDPANVTSLVDMIQRSSCSVTTLELCLPLAPDPPILPLFPKLTTLTIDMGGLPYQEDLAPWNLPHMAADLTARIANGEDFVLCPLIETLVVFNASEWFEFAKSTKILMDLVEARFSDGGENTRLRCLKLMYCYSRYEEGFVQQLQALCARGLDIRVFYDDGLNECVF